jgi:hypothetical protein
MPCKQKVAERLGAKISELCSYIYAAEQAALIVKALDWRPVSSLGIVPVALNKTVERLWAMQPVPDDAKSMPVSEAIKLAR